MKKVLSGLLLAVLVALTSSVYAEGVVIAKDSKVKLDYTLTVGGETVETTQGKEPLSYTHGQGMLIVGLEKALEGMKAGESKKVDVKAAEGYGDVDARLVREFDRAKLPADMAPEVGMVLEMQDPQGTSFPCTISEVKEKSVLLDFNHPLAGKDLSFDVKVVAIE